MCCTECTSYKQVSSVGGNTQTSLWGPTSLTGLTNDLSHTIRNVFLVSVS